MSETSRRSLDSHDPSQAFFGIIQGSVYPDLRAESAEFIASLDTDGIAIGGVSVGEGKELMMNAVEWTVPHLPQSKPRYLMGVGTPEDLLDSVMRGIDMFDCVLPTRLGRNGSLYTTFGRINIKITTGYDVDAETVIATLESCVAAHPGVLKQPPPAIMLTEFGATALTFEIFCIVPNLGDRGQVKSDIFIAILKQFRAAGIELSPPQDVRLTGQNAVPAGGPA